MIDVGERLFFTENGEEHYEGIDVCIISAIAQFYHEHDIVSYLLLNYALKSLSSWKWITENVKFS